MRISIHALRDIDPSGIQQLTVKGSFFGPVLICSTRDRADKFLTQLQNLLVEYTDQDLEIIEGDENGHL